MRERPMRFFVMISGEAYNRLVDRADQDRRTPQNQAAVMLEELLATDELANELANGLMEQAAIPV